MHNWFVLLIAMTYQNMFVKKNQMWAYGWAWGHGLTWLGLLGVEGIPIRWGKIRRILVPRRRSPRLTLRKNPAGRRTPLSTMFSTSSSRNASSPTPWDVRTSSAIASSWSLTASLCIEAWTNSSNSETMITLMSTSIVHHTKRSLLYSQCGRWQR